MPKKFSLQKNNKIKPINFGNLKLDTDVDDKDSTQHQQKQEDLELTCFGGGGGVDQAQVSTSTPSGEADTQSRNPHRRVNRKDSKKSNGPKNRNAAATTGGVRKRAPKRKAESHDNEQTDNRAASAVSSSRDFPALLGSDKQLSRKEAETIIAFEHEDQGDQGRAPLEELNIETSQDLQNLLFYLKRLHQHFLAQAARLTAIIEPSMEESLNYFKNLRNSFLCFYQELEESSLAGISSNMSDHAKLFDESINFVNKRCKEIKVLKRTNDAKADEVERLLEYVQKMQCAISVTSDIRRMPSAVRPLVRPTFDYVPESENKVVFVSKRAPLPRAISIVPLKPPPPPPTTTTTTKPEATATATDMPPPPPPVKRRKMTKEEERAFMEEELERACQEVCGDMYEKTDSAPPQDNAENDASTVADTGPVLITQMGTEERDQSMAPSQRTRTLNQSMIHRFTSPFDSTEAHASKRSSRFSDAEHMRQIYEAAAKNRDSLPSDPPAAKMARPANQF